MDQIRLIDANALRCKIARWMAESDKSSLYADAVESFAYSEVLDAIDAAPTIVSDSPGGSAQKEVCNTCCWYGASSGTCYNALSEHRAKPTDPEDSCRWWE